VFVCRSAKCRNTITVLVNRVLIYIYTDLQGNLESTLRQFIGPDQQLDKPLDAPDKYITEEDLIPLMEMTHSLQQGDEVPFFECVNRSLLQLVKSANILELINIDIDNPPENLNQSRSRSFSVAATVNNEESVVKELIRNAMDNPSPQVCMRTHNLHTLHFFVNIGNS